MPANMEIAYTRKKSWVAQILLLATVALSFYSPRHPTAGVKHGAKWKKSYQGKSTKTQGHSLSPDRGLHAKDLVVWHNYVVLTQSFKLVSFFTFIIYYLVVHASDATAVQRVPAVSCTVRWTRTADRRWADSSCWDLQNACVIRTPPSGPSNRKVDAACTSRWNLDQRCSPTASQIRRQCLHRYITTINRRN